MTPILHGTALCPLFRFPRGARLRLKVVMDADLPLAGKGLLFAARTPHTPSGPLFRATLAGSTDAWTFSSPNTVELALAPTAIDETAESELTLADLQAQGSMLWRLDILDGDTLPILRLQGDLEWLQEEGAWPDEPTSTAAIPTMTVSIVAGVATVSVALISDGVSLTNESVNTAIEEDPDASRAALELGSAALADADDFATGAEGDLAATALQPAAIGVTVLAPTGNGSALTALNPSALGAGTGPITLQAGGTNQNVRLLPSGSGKLELSQYGCPIIVPNSESIMSMLGHTFFYFDWAGNILCGQDIQPQGDGAQDLGRTSRRWRRLWINSTVTPSGTTGAQTINKGAGAVNFAAAATSLVVTNSLVTTDSHILACVASNDSTMKAVRVVAGSGSFTLYADTAPSAETRVDFCVIN